MLICWCDDPPELFFTRLTLSPLARQVCCSYYIT